MVGMAIIARMNCKDRRESQMRGDVHHAPHHTYFYFAVTFWLEGFPPDSLRVVPE
jgi:hypothetical protein